LLYFVEFKHRILSGQSF